VGASSHAICCQWTLWWRLPSFAGPDSAFITGQSLVVDGGAYDH
jgi:hypothetical protein